MEQISIPTSLDNWITRESIPFSFDSEEALNGAIDKMISSLGDTVKLLGFGEALHGGEDILILRNRLFERLVEAHGYSAIAIESSLSAAQVVNKYVSGHGLASYKEVQDTGFSHGFGKLEANRELVEWIRRYNSNPFHQVKIQFYGFDIPSLAAGIASPRQVLEFALNYLSLIDSKSGQERGQRINSLLGQDAQWENPAALTDPTKAIGLSPEATALRIETEDLITEFRIRRPEFVALSDKDQYSEALQYALIARELLNFHAAIARQLDNAGLLSIRDSLMTDNLAYIMARERSRGKVLVFAHNSHLQRGKTTLRMGAEVCAWWAAGSHLNEMFGSRYAVIGSAVGVSDDNGIGQPENNTLEARLTALPGVARFIPTHTGFGIATEEITALPTRSGSMKNPSYVALTPQSFTDFDWLAVLNSTVYNRGGAPLQQR
jgi:erythromycin esterase-like protein